MAQNQEPLPKVSRRIAEWRAECDDPSTGVRTLYTKLSNGFGLANLTVTTCCPMIGMGQNNIVMQYAAFDHTAGSTMTGELHITFLGYSVGGRDQPRTRR